jgi:hypothetical protein
MGSYSVVEGIGGMEERYSLAQPDLSESPNRSTQDEEPIQRGECDLAATACQARGQIFRRVFELGDPKSLHELASDENWNLSI